VTGFGTSGVKPSRGFYQQTSCVSVANTYKNITDKLRILYLVVISCSRRTAVYSSYDIVSGFPFQNEF